MLRWEVVERQELVQIVGVLAIAGALSFEAGYTAARRGDTGTAWRHWDTDRAMADRLPPATTIR